MVTGSLVIIWKSDKNVVYLHMKVVKNEYDYNIFYEVDDLSSFGEVELSDFDKIKKKKVAFINEEYDLFIVELEKKEKFYKYKDYQILLLVSDDKYFETNWNGKFLDVMETSVEDYDIKMLDKVRKSDVKYFTTQF